MSYEPKTPFPNNFRSGYMPQGSPLGAVTKSVMLTADNTQVSFDGFTLIYLSSDDTTAANRTFTSPVSGLVGHQVTILFVSAGSTTCQLLNAGTMHLQADWEPEQYDCITLISTGTYWAEVSRGATMLPPGAIVNADIASNAAIDFSKLAALTSGHILVGSAGTVPTNVALSGDATLIASGALTIANSAVTTAKIAAGNVTLAKLAAGITPSHITVFAGTKTTVGGSATEAFTVTGVAATDVVTLQMTVLGTGSRTILTVVPTLNTLTVVFSGDPSNNHQFFYNVLRAAS